MGFLDAYRVVDFTNERGLLAGRLLAGPPRQAPRAVAGE